jgi:hypothetical protein
VEEEEEEEDGEMSCRRGVLYPSKIFVEGNFN